mgnify:CR=1 FL=1
MTKKNKQTQKAGNESVLIQAETIVSGISAKDAMDIMQHVWNENFPNLQRIAKEEAEKKAEDLRISIMEELALHPHNILNEFKSPRKQNDLFNAQKGFAISSGKDELKNILSRLITKSFDQFSNAEISDIIFSEAVETAPKLSVSQFKALSIILLNTELKFIGNTPENLLNNMWNIFEKINCSKDDLSDINFELLSCQRCVNILPFTQQNFYEKAKTKYTGLFCNGIPRDIFVEQLGHSIFKEANIIPSFHAPNNLQPGYASSDEINSLNIGEDAKRKLIGILDNNVFSPEQIKEKICQIKPDLFNFIETMNNSPIINCRLSPVGKTIAHAHIGRLVEKLPNLKF